MDDCSDPLQVDFDRPACLDTVDDEAMRDDGGPSVGRRDGGRRDAGSDARASRPRDEGLDDADFADGFDDDDDTCRRGRSRKCQCPSGAYGEQVCAADQSWQACACGGPPLVFGDGSVRADAGRDAAVTVPDAGPTVPALSWEPVAAGTAVPDCRAPQVPPVAPRSTRWLAFTAWSSTALQAVHLVELGAAGPLAPPVAGPSILAGSELGLWSSDGARFAFDSVEHGGPTALYVATVDASPAAPLFELLAADGRLVGWAPGRPLLAARTSGWTAFKVLNVTAPATELAHVGLGQQHPDTLAWSSDGRYVGLSSSMPGALSVLDVDAVPALTTAIDAQGSLLRWSPDGRRFSYVVYARDVNELWVVDWSGTVATKQKVGEHVYSVGNYHEPQWLDADRLLWKNLESELFLTDLSGPTPVTTPLGIRPPYYSVSPNGACIAFAGPCGTANERGVCVSTLTGAAAPVLVSRLPFGDVSWSSGGDKLALVSSAGQLLEALNFDGLPFAPKLIGRVQTPSVTPASLRWAPGTPARWLAHTALVEEYAPEGTVSLWHAESSQTFTVPLKNGTARDMSWAPDGRFLALYADNLFTPDMTSNAMHLAVQYVDEQRPGVLTELHEFVLPPGLRGRKSFVFQP